MLMSLCLGLDLFLPIKTEIFLWYQIEEPKIRENKKQGKESKENDKSDRSLRRL